MNGVMVRPMITVGDLVFNTRHTDPDLRPRFQIGRRILTPMTYPVYGRGGDAFNVSNAHVTDNAPATYVLRK